MDVLLKLNAALAGRYAIEREIGAGGMATVYLARDLRHDRAVALKVLRPELGAVLGVERFLAEIKVTANLQHPNLLPLFDSGEADGLLYYVMPYVQGESLRARLGREHQLPVDDAIRIAVGVASALDYAHQRGVIHRDLKPENILLQAGQPMVADFGIALAVSTAGGDRITQTGLSLGTPQYMSPEQATGDRAIDARTDVYSLGAVLYEMLAGEPPHVGTSAQSVIAKLLTERPRDVRTLRPSVPEHVALTMHRALERLAADRWPSARDLAEALTGARPATTLSSAAGSGTRASAAARAATIVPWSVAAAAIALGAWGWLRTKPAAVTRAHFTVVPEPGARLRIDRPGVRIAISPDGSQLVYVGGDSGPPRLFLRRLDDPTPHALSGTEGARDPEFSPDGKSIAFAVRTRLMKVPLAGGPAQVILDSAAGRYSWGDRDILLIDRPSAGPSALWRARASGGAPEPVTRPDTSGDLAGSHLGPHFLPGAEAALFTLSSFRGPPQLALVRLGDRKITKLGVVGTSPRYVASGHVLFARQDGAVYAVPFDLRTLRVTGTPFPVLSGVAMSLASGTSDFAVSRNGTLAYVEGEGARQFVLVDRNGGATPLLSARASYAFPRFSPDGHRVALSIGAIGQSDVWVLDIRAGTLSRVTSDGMSTAPDWMPDGRRLAFGSLRHGMPSIFSQPWDKSDSSSLLVARASIPIIARSGGFLVTLGFQNGTDIERISLDSTRERRTLVGTPAADLMPDISPDGAWLAYVSLESGRSEVYVRAMTGAGGRRQISTDGAVEPRWAPNGRELFYRTSDQRRMMVARLGLTPELTVVGRDVLFADPFFRIAVNTSYDVAPDGQHFVMVRAPDVQSAVHIVFGWLDDLRTRSGATSEK